MEIVRIRDVPDILAEQMVKCTGKKELFNTYSRRYSTLLKRFV